MITFYKNHKIVNIHHKNYKCCCNSSVHQTALISGGSLGKRDKWKKNPNEWDSIAHEESAEAENKITFT